MIMRKISLVLLTLFICFNSYASRVTEMEFRIASDTEKFLKDIFGDNIISVNVEVKPLKRIGSSSETSESLPFMYVENQQVTDEWDNQEISIFQLYNRIASAKIKVVLKDSVEIQNIDRFKTNLLNYLKLKPGRDYVEVDFEARFFSLKKDIASYEKYIYPTLIGFLLITFLVWGLKNIQPKVPIATSATSSGTQSVATAPSIRVANSEVTSKSSSVSASSNISLSDPTKTIALIKSKIEQIESSGTFPTLNDMILFEELLYENADAFSFLVYEFTQENQNKLFSMGTGDHWYKAYSEIGSPSIACINFLEKMARNRNYHATKPFEELLISCWRMGGKLKDVVAALDFKEAISILYYLPKSVSIPVARSAYPGRWAEVLSDVKVAAINNFDKIEQTKKLALNIYPSLSIEALESYRKQRDLLIYLKTATPSEEEDVYKILGDQSKLKSIRPPFYALFELEDSKRREVIDQLSLDQWAIALFNVSRDQRKMIDEVLNDKEKYLLSESLKALDQSPPAKAEVGELRERIAKMVVNYVSQQIESVTSQNPGASVAS
jgi:hypothetical protein